SLVKYAGFLRDQDMYGRARACLEEALAIYKSVKTKPGILYPQALFWLALDDLTNSRPARAEQLLTACLPFVAAEYGDNSANMAAVRNMVARAMIEQGKSGPDVEDLLAHATSGFRTSFSGLLR